VRKLRKGRLQKIVLHLKFYAGNSWDITAQKKEIGWIGSKVMATGTDELDGNGVLLVRRYANAVFAIIACPSVRPSVCLSKGGIASKWLNVGSQIQRNIRIYTH